MEQEQNCCNQIIEQQAETENIDLLQVKEIQWYTNKQENSSNRLNICQTCEELVAIVNICKQCGCLMNIKTRIYSATCPLEKW